MPDATETSRSALFTPFTVRGRHRAEPHRDRADADVYGPRRAAQRMAHRAPAEVRARRRRADLHRSARRVARRSQHLRRSRHLVGRLRRATAPHRRHATRPRRSAGRPDVPLRGRRPRANARGRGYGPLSPTETARGELPWQPMAPSPVAKVEGWSVPHALSIAEVEAVVEGIPPGRAALPRSRLRRAQHSRRAWLPAALVLLAAEQPAHRPLWRLVRGTHPPAA